MKKYIVGVTSFLLPAFTVFAQTVVVSNSGQISNISQLVNRIDNVINIIIPFVVGLAVLVIIYGIFSFISSAGDEEKRATAKQFIIWGIIGVFIMLSVWGLISILVTSFPLTSQSAQSAASGPQTMVPVQGAGSY